MRISLQNKETKKHTNFTIGEVEQYISEFKKLIKNNRFTISRNEKRKENIEFLEAYKINVSKVKEILLNIGVHDFCYAVDNKNPNFAYEKLYIFCPQYELDNWGQKKSVDIYIKMNLIENMDRNKYMIVVSFHKRNKPVTYLFR
ncbi:MULTISPECIES: hypothetical protein [Bacillus cereus group]|uniref:Uncharacterized protein n=1 Tax=Bacillus thuringiensis serovar mexicanensis TaxID=180868 RepID=A0A242WF14_BACTU|nr:MULTISPECIES: hypothetical protein [Bacillus cereus group]EEM56131.1 hypothetical protein bthur0007_60340 [Bacillus thuringiensis serovar monterrey BGSC 4AJ1]MEB9673130.1 hypothetical protein [Bacillus anthracis]OTW54400.1 hypothetical protein BK699_03410 [Bacillus thuringiensis serovar mexicanensis]OTW98202.1 hypothetical protein BK705_24050 [Bacillus thuringiensis serovar monterrey]